MVTAQTIRELINESLALEDEPFVAGEDEDLLSQLDSLQVLRIVADFERRYAIKIDHGEISAENFGTLARMASFLDGKMA
jgi:acyl carrier protein